MRLAKNILLENFTDNVREIIAHPFDEEYSKMISGMPEKDIKTAILVMNDKVICKNKVRKCESELRVRKSDSAHFYGELNLKGEWGKWFAKEWNAVRKAAGHEC